MCGGYSLTKDIKKLVKKYDIPSPDFNYHPRFNARPSQNMPVILNDLPKHLTLAHWGITPFWAKDKPDIKQIINTRIESADKITFKKDFLERRCLIPADGFLEWAKTKTGKQPYYFRLKSAEIFSFAGIWEDDEKLRIPTFTILTTKPNSLVEKIHDRMPVLLNPDQESAWLNPKTDIISLLAKIKPFPADKMTDRPISRKINSAQNDYPELLEPLSENVKLF